MSKNNVQNGFLAALIWGPIFVYVATNARIAVRFKSSLVKVKKGQKEGDHIQKDKKDSNGTIQTK